MVIVRLTRFAPNFNFHLRAEPLPIPLSLTRNWTGSGTSHEMGDDFSRPLNVDPGGPPGPGRPPGLASLRRGYHTKARLHHPDLSLGQVNPSSLSGPNDAGVMRHGFACGGGGQEALSPTILRLR